MPTPRQTEHEFTKEELKQRYDAALEALTEAGYPEEATRSEVAGFFNRSERTVTGWTQTYGLRFKTAGHRRYPRKLMAEFMARNPWLEIPAEPEPDLEP